MTFVLLLTKLKITHNLTTLVLHFGMCVDSFEVFFRTLSYFL